MDAGITCIKYLIFIFNFLFWVSGLAIIIVGSIIYVQIDKYGAVLNSSITSGVVLLIVVGCIVTVIAFFGCCGACKENHCMVVTFSVLLGIIFVLELAAGITCYVYRNEIDRITNNSFNETWSKYGSESETKTVDMIQHDLECCGVNGPADWVNYPWSKSHTGLPDSCCEDTAPGKCTTTSTNVQKEGCYNKLKRWFESELLIIAGVGIGVAFIELIGIAFACCLASAIRKNYEVV